MIIHALLLTLGILAAPAHADLSDSGNLSIGGNGVIAGTMTVQGNAFSVGGSSFTVVGGSATTAYQHSAGSMKVLNIASGTQCVQADSSGNLTGTGSTCGTVTVGLSSSCAAGSYWDTTTLSNGVMNGGVCTALPSAGETSYFSAAKTFGSSVTFNAGMKITGTVMLNGYALADNAWQSKTYSNANGNFTTPATSSMVYVTMCGAGGGGGTGGSSQGGGGGGSGETIYHLPLYVGESRTIAYVAGAGGAKGAASSDGSPGGNSSINFTDLSGSSITYYAGGGLGGLAAGSGGRGGAYFATPQEFFGGAGGIVGAPGNISTYTLAMGGIGSTFVYGFGGGGGSGSAGKSNRGAGPNFGQGVALTQSGGGGAGSMFGTGGNGAKSAGPVAATAALGYCAGGGGSSSNGSGAGTDGGHGMVTFEWIGPPNP